MTALTTDPPTITSIIVASHGDDTDLDSGTIVGAAATYRRIDD